ncbi:NADH:ubiquinone oxidoreductase [Batrachochytrium dendrobatidis]|nr:NADH:ubiquinone oxidoreductase [Batrachochytrium dendrobatidis]
MFRSIIRQSIRIHKTPLVSHAFRPLTLIAAPNFARMASSAVVPASQKNTHSPKKPIFWRLVRLSIAGVVVVGTGSFAYELYVARHPSAQFDWDPSKKTVAILGSGWAATSFLTDLDTDHYNVVIVSPRNYFLFTPLLPSCTVGTVELRSIMQPIRYLTRFKKRQVVFIEGDCNSIDPTTKTLSVSDNSEIVGVVSKQTIPYDYLVVACGAENATFGIPGVREHACFLKEAWDAKKIRTRLMDCLETAAFPGQTDEEIRRLLHMVVVGGGPTGVEYAAELYDFLHEDLLTWYPDLAGKFKITLVEASPHVLPMFSKQLIEYTEHHFAANKVTILNNTSVKQVNQRDIQVMDAEKNLNTIPYGLIVWATGNTARPIVQDLIKKLPSDVQNQRRGLVVDDFLAIKGATDMFGLGDATATKWAPTAQVASRQGRYLANMFNHMGELDTAKTNPKESSLALTNATDPAYKTPNTSATTTLHQALMACGPFQYDHLGSLAYIGKDHAIAEFPFGVTVGGAATYFFWRSAYLSTLFSLRNRVLVAFDWAKKKCFGRDISRE